MLYKVEEVYISIGSNKSKYVLALIHKNASLSIVQTDVNSWFLVLLVQISYMTIDFMNLYSPNLDWPKVFHEYLI